MNNFFKVNLHKIVGVSIIIVGILLYLSYIDKCIELNMKINKWLTAIYAFDIIIGIFIFTIKKFIK